jgi:hypothetical protein
MQDEIKKKGRTITSEANVHEILFDNRSIGEILYHLHKYCIEGKFFVEGGVEEKIADIIFFEDRAYGWQVTIYTDKQ